MKPYLLDQSTIDDYLAAGHWTRETMVERYAAYARDVADTIACRDGTAEITWRQLDEITDCIAANLIGRGIGRDARALVQMPSSSREMVLRAAFKKAGIIGCFAPMQWRRKELDYTFGEIDPSAVFFAPEALEDGRSAWLDEAIAGRAEPTLRVGMASDPPTGWLPWSDLEETPPTDQTMNEIAARQFRFDEISLITASSGTSGIAKLCEWPEAAQICIGRGIAERLRLDADENVGMFAPMSGAAGVLVWVTSAAVPATFTFPDTFNAPDLLRLVGEQRITLATTVPVILARIAQADLAAFDLASLRAIRVGTAVADMDAAHAIESRSNCRVVVASGSMECPGFGHADIDEPAALRLNGGVGLPLPGCRLRVDDDTGNSLPADEIGHVKVTAPFASSGYWNDAKATAEVWTDGWYSTGDMGTLDGDGRLTLLGRRKEVVNRSGHKILPIEVEREIAKHPTVFQCAVVAAPDAEYGQVPWAFVQVRDGMSMDAGGLAAALREGGLATYKIPARFIELEELPRVSGNKIDKKRLLDMVPAE